LSPTTAGALTTTDPTTTGQVSKPILIPDTATTALVLDYRGLVVSSGGGGGAVFDPSTGSWLWVNSQSDTGLAGKSGTSNAFVTVPWTPSGFITTNGSGSDIGVNGSGNIVINTAGVYAVHAYINAQASTTGATGYTEGSGRLLINTARVGTNLRLTDTAFPASSLLNRQYMIFTLSETLYLAAGDTITTQARMVSNGTPTTTWAITEAEIYVERHQ
jgi:hypothetical protein